MKLRPSLRNRLIATAFVLVALSVVAWRVWPRVAAALGAGRAGAPAPALRVTTLRGDTLSLAGLRGKVVLVNFWATWCAPCRAEMPGFQAVYEADRERGLVILGIAEDDDGPVPVSGFVVHYGITYPIAMYTPATEQLFGGINAIPTTFLIDRAGRIRYQVRGTFARPALEQAVDRLLAEPAPRTLD